MKKILFSLVALVCSMSMNAQVMKVMKNGEEVAKYNGADYEFVFEEEPAVQPYSVTFDKWMNAFSVSGNDDEKLIASNDDVTVELVLSSSDGPGMPPSWNAMGDVRGGDKGGKLTVTVTAKDTGVTITGIAIQGSDNNVTKTGSGPYEFTLGTGFALQRFYDGDTKIGSISKLTVNYTK